jgi:hypothetical protein
MKRGPYKKKSLQVRFWKWVDVRGPNDCWLWTGTICGPDFREGIGYGNLTVNKQKRLSHRVAFELTFGAIPIGLEVLHKCDVKRCCNPGHLFA